MRIDATAGQMQVAVFKGDVQLEDQAQPVTRQEKETLTLDPKSGASYTVAKGTEALAFDNWNKEREDYTNTYAENAGYGGPSRAYGLQDLNYYGAYFYATGYGYVWQPYGFANSMIGWNPYSNGAWMFYPGMGYSWASAYPWGWLPYHYGSWAFIKGAGWAWLPGNQYNGQWQASNFSNAPTVRKAPAGWTAATPPVDYRGECSPAHRHGWQARRFSGLRPRRTHSPELWQRDPRTGCRLQCGASWVCWS